MFAFLEAMFKGYIKDRVLNPGHERVSEWVAAAKAEDPEAQLDEAGAKALLSVMQDELISGKSFHDIVAHSQK